MRDDLETLINETAYRIVRRFRNFVEPEDVRQEMRLWAYARKNYVTGLKTFHLTRALQRVGEGYARKEKAAKTGYSPADEVFYSMGVLRELLPIAVTDEPVVLRGVNPDDKQGARRAGSTPAFEYETAIADVRKAYKALPDEKRLVLLLYVAGKEVPAVEVTRAVRGMQRRLGGRRPIRSGA